MMLTPPRLRALCRILTGHYTLSCFVAVALTNPPGQVGPWCPVTAIRVRYHDVDRTRWEDVATVPVHDTDTEATLTAHCARVIHARRAYWRQMAVAAEARLLRNGILMRAGDPMEYVHSSQRANP